MVEESNRDADVEVRPELKEQVAPKERRRELKEQQSDHASDEDRNEADVFSGEHPVDDGGRRKRDGQSEEPKHQRGSKDPGHEGPVRDHAVEVGEHVRPTLCRHGERIVGLEDQRYTGERTLKALPGHGSPPRGWIDDVDACSVATVEDHEVPKVPVKDSATL
jgi:hypothetical protein